jgi:hypothetical protein
MAQMAEILEQKPEPKVCVDPNLIELDKLPIPEVNEVNVEEIQEKKRLKGIITKFRKHAKYHEELKCMDVIKGKLMNSNADSQFHSRNFGVY